jgi:hypothetical protein
VSEGTTAPGASRAFARSRPVNHEARVELVKCLELVALLRPLIDPGAEGSKPFERAMASALMEARDAARTYTAEAETDPQLPVGRK